MNAFEALQAHGVVWAGARERGLKAPRGTCRKHIKPTKPAHYGFSRSKILYQHWPIRTVDLGLDIDTETIYPCRLQQTNPPDRRLTAC